MIADELTYRIRSAFAFTPTAEQERAIEVFTQFMTDRHEQSLMILRGSAGTGKTTLAAALVRALCSLQQKIVLLAPTGRAAKVFSLYAGHPAYTIHRRIYRQKSMEGTFNLNYNTAQDTLFIVDEASMVANATTVGDTPFANGQLLDDLIQFVYNGRNCRMMLIGDTAQLPPVGEEESPALQTDIMRSYGLHVHQCDLNEVLRQSQESGILWNATMIRQLITHDGPMQMPVVRFEGFSDIRRMPGDELIESLASSYSHVGTDETMVITRSNKRANIYNQGIRNMVLGPPSAPRGATLRLPIRRGHHDLPRLRRLPTDRHRAAGHADLRGTCPHPPAADAAVQPSDARLCRHTPEARPAEETARRPTLQCPADQVRIRRHLPQGAGRTVGTRIRRPGIHDRRHAQHRLPALAIHRLHASHRTALPRQLAHQMIIFLN